MSDFNLLFSEVHCLLFNRWFLCFIHLAEVRRLCFITGTSSLVQGRY